MEIVLYIGKFDDKVISKADSIRLPFENGFNPFFIREFLIKDDLVVKDIPRCVLSDYPGTFKNPFSPLKKKFSQCSKCIYNKECGGMFSSYANKYGDNAFVPIINGPSELVLELTFRCHLNCSFCFNKHSKGEELDFKLALEYIDRASEMGIPFIRFTGGEPLLHPNFFEILDYAYSKNFMEIRLNTTGIIVPSFDKLSMINNVLFSFHSWDEDSEKSLTGGSLKAKIESARKLKKLGVDVVRAGTIATDETIAHFDDIFSVVKEFDAWEWYRPIPSPNNETLLTENSLKLLLNKLLDIKKKWRYVPIANAIPFCFSSLVSYVSLGGRFDDGNSRLVVSPRGYLKPSYYVDINLGRNIDLAWKKWREELSDVKEPCSSCNLFWVCKGGSRFYSKDPLIREKN